MRRESCLVCLTLFFAPTLAQGQEGRLGGVREEVHQPDPPPAAPVASDADKRQRDRERDLERQRQAGDTSWMNKPEDDPGNSIFGWLILSLFTLERDADTDAHIEPYSGPHYSPRYPYRRGYPGFLTVHPDTAREVADYWQNAPMKTWWGTVSLEGGSNFDDLHRFGLRAHLDSTSRLGIITGWNFYREKLACGCTDDLSIGDANLTYRLFQSHLFQMHTGLGLRWLSDRHDTDFGVNVYVGADVFPVRPLVISTSLDFGTLGDANVFHFRATAGLVHKHWEIFSGYDYLSIGDVDLQGPLLGLRVWF